MNRSALVALGRLPYTATLKALQSAARVLPGSPTLWARNSYLSDAFTPGRSDLDITVHYETEPSKSALGYLKAALRIARSCFPALGECNVYVRAEALRLRTLANELELARDPILKTLLGGTGSNLDSEAGACVFLLRMLEADLANLMIRPEKRARKWERHFAEIAPKRGSPGSISMRSITATAVSLLGMSAEDDAQATAELIDYFEARTERRALHELPRTRWVRALLPHRTCFDLQVEKPLLGKPLDASLGQIAWEVWGLSSQYRLSTDRQGIAEHLGRLEILIGRIDSSLTRRIAEDVSLLRKSVSEG